MKKINVFFFTKTRGFFEHLFNTEFDFLSISGKKSYEVPSSINKFLSKIVRSKFADHIGIIQKSKVGVTDADVLGSFNRFLKTDRPYFIYLENQTALYHYSIQRNKTLFGKKKYKKYLSDKNLKYIFCMSHACYDKIQIDLSNNINSEVIYPLVNENEYVDDNTIEERISKNTLRLLFITQGSRFISKGGPEVVEAIRKMVGMDISLTLITEKRFIPEKTIKLIDDSANINLLEFGFSFDEMKKIYANHDILLHPTSDDSFSLTVLEAVKAGLTIIATNMYAIPEMVKDGTNGYTCDPKWNFFDKENNPNPKVWNNRKKTIYDYTFIDERIVNFLINKVKYLYENEDVLRKMSLNSLRIAESEPFSSAYIKKQWTNSIKYIMGE